jgi:hypothetical protein
MLPCFAIPHSGDDRCSTRPYQRVRIRSSCRKKLDELIRLKPQPFAPLKCLAMKPRRRRAPSRRAVTDPRAARSPLATPITPKTVRSDTLALPREAQSGSHPCYINILARQSSCLIVSCSAARPQGRPTLRIKFHRSGVCFSAGSTLALLVPVRAAEGFSCLRRPALHRDATGICT